MANPHVYIITVLIDQEQMNKRGRLVFKTHIAGNKGLFDFIAENGTPDVAKRIKNGAIGELRKTLTRLKNKKGMI